MSEEKKKRSDRLEEAATPAERQAEEARKKLADAEERADETVEHAAEDLRELTEEQEATAERLRREMGEPTSPLPPAPGTEEEEGDQLGRPGRG